MNKRKTALALILFLFLPLVTLTIHMFPIFAFSPQSIAQGLVVQVPKSEYAIGEEVFLTVRLLNNLTTPVQVFYTTIGLEIIGASGPVLGLIIHERPRASDPSTVQPGDEMFVFGFPWDQRGGNEPRQVPLGEYTVIARIEQLGRWGSVSILIMPL